MIPISSISLHYSFSSGFPPRTLFPTIQMPDSPAIEFIYETLHASIADMPTLT
jgi:hypothetical protein